jgi:hypothetical protein
MPGLAFDIVGVRRTQWCVQAGSGNKTAGQETWPAETLIPHARAGEAAYFRWFETSLVISNIETVFLPPKTAFSFSSPLMLRLLIGSWSLFFLM